MGKEKEPKPKADDTKKSEARAKSAARERRHPVWRVLKYASITVGSAMLFVGGAGIGYITSMLKGLPSVTASTFTNNSAASVIYDRNGQVIGRITSDGDRQPISSIHQVSKNLVNAFVAAEDKTFYTNIGINPLSMGRAVIQDVLGHRIESGASTITQQTVKLAVFPKQERTLHRKVQEIALALELNHVLSKDEIMTDYMNWVYMGRMGVQNVYGVETASEILFHKSPDQLNLPEAALLAAIPNNASYFSPYQFPKHALERQHYILNQMLADHMINETEYHAAIKYDVLKDIKPAPSSSYGKYPYLMLLDIEPTIYRNLVKAGIYDSIQQAEAAVPTAGYKIYTSIDLHMQDDIDNVLHNKQLFAGTNMTWQGPNGKTQTDLYEAGVTLIDNQTGAILAIGGGRNYAQDSYDHSDIPRQPGSSIKPLMDYGPAIDLHRITAGTVLDDAPVTYPSGNGGTWSPHDDESFQGIVTAREALTQSMNVPAIKILDMITPQVGLDYMGKMGITTTSKTLFGQPTLVPSDAHLSSAIGGLMNGVTVQQMTSAYTVFPNQGVWHESYLISKITDRNGNPIFTFKPKVNTVFSPQTAYIMTSMMHDVVTKGTAQMIGANFPGYMISGKTGTTDNQTDGWFIGYTQKYTMGIWMGYNHNESIPTSIYGLKFQLWNDMMAPILAKNPPTQPWPQPPGIVTENICSKSGQLPTALCQADNDVYPELFIQGTQPTQTCNVMVEAKYVVINGQKYLATTNTPPNEIRTGIFLKPPFAVPNTPVADSSEYLPTQPDPRGGTILDGGSTTMPPATSLPAPSQATAVDEAGQVHVSWSSVPGASGYTVWRATGPNGPFTNVGGRLNGTSFVDTRLPANASTLYYEIYAISNNSMSEPSRPVIVLTGAGGHGSPEGNGGGSATPGISTTPGSNGNATDGVNRTGNPETIWIPGEGFKRH